MTEPCDLTAVEARRLIGRKALSPLELTDSCIARIEAVDGNVNAMVTRCFDRARSEAKAAEHAVARGDDLGLLHGFCCWGGWISDVVVGWFVNSA